MIAKQQWGLPFYIDKLNISKGYCSKRRKSFVGEKGNTLIKAKTTTGYGRNVIA